MNRIHLTAAALITTSAAVAALTGCATTTATPAASIPAGSNHPTTSTSVVADTQPSTSSPMATSTPGNGTAAFGRAYTWDDGLSVTIAAPQPYTPSQSAAGVVAGQTAVALQITVVNGTSAPFDPVLFTVSAQSGNTEASKIYDSAKNIGGGPSTKVLAGRETTYKVAFSVADPKDLIVEFSPDFTHRSVLFAS